MSSRRFMTGGAVGKSARSWTAPVLWRFGGALGMRRGKLFLDLITLVRKRGRGLPRSKTLRDPVCRAPGSPFRHWIEVVRHLEFVEAEPVDRLDLRGWGA